MIDILILTILISLRIWREMEKVEIGIIDIFFSDEGQMGFEDFLDMMSVFSEGATRDVKASYAFRIYGINYALTLPVTIALLLTLP